MALITETVQGDPLKFELSLIGRSEVLVMQVSDGLLSGFCVETFWSFCIKFHVVQSIAPTYVLQEIYPTIACPDDFE